MLNTQLLKFEAS